ncbi:hypothetical protein FQ775_23740 [Nitratireductor mangrovi]|uniref:Uncharacterized protein n=1 Tax=Nitratireductor mangrovi TaxID=2599600 RepID=A0A6H0DY99_9HYPH|nr:hypothetical protein [Nitratireductor mangrovi]QIS94621.1 hypothetical protein FQ775_23740 [Nitratireductor mangrovi]
MSERILRPLCLRRAVAAAKGKRVAQQIADAALYTTGRLDNTEAWLILPDASKSMIGI